MKVPTKALLVVGGLFLAFGVGTLHGNTEVETVRIPQYITKVETHTVTEPAKPFMLPQSCIDAFKLAEVLAVPNTAISKSAGALLDSLSDVTRDAATQDMASLNHSLEVVRNQKIILGDAVIADTETREQLNTKLVQCQSEIKGQ